MSTHYSVNDVKYIIWQATRFTTVHLFNIFIYDLPFWVIKTDIGNYADDITPYVFSCYSLLVCIDWTYSQKDRRKRICWCLAYRFITSFWINKLCAFIPEVYTRGFNVDSLKPIHIHFKCRKHNVKIN